MTYTTQMDAAKKGMITPEIRTVAAKEALSTDRLMDLMAQGRVIIPANKHHASLCAEGIGEGLRTKINVNLGISKDCADVDREMEKVRLALDLKTEAIMDLSCSGKTQDFRQRLEMGRASCRERG